MLFVREQVAYRVCVCVVLLEGVGCMRVGKIVLV